MNVNYRYLAFAGPVCDFQYTWIVFWLDKFWIILTNLWHKFELQNFLKLSFCNILCLCFNFVGCDSFFESSTHDNLSFVRQIWKINCSTFSVGCYLLLILKNYVTQVYGLAVYMKQGLPFARFSFLKNSYNFYFYSFLFYSLHLLP